MTRKKVSWIMVGECSDMPRMLRLRRAMKEAMKPSRWYYDDPADTGSLYRKRWLATLDVALDILANSSDKKLVDFATGMLGLARSQLPRTFDKWCADNRVEFDFKPAPNVDPDDFAKWLANGNPEGPERVLAKKKCALIGYAGGEKDPPQGVGPLGRVPTAT
jgi:hypothetical protein